MHSEKGITLISLVVIIIVLLILTGTATYTGINTINNVRRTEFVTELQTIQSKVNLYNEKGENSYKDLGQILTNQIDNEKKESILNSENINISDFNSFKYFDTKDYAQMGLSGIKKPTLIDFKNKRIISAQGIEMNNKMYYTLEQLGESTYNVGYTDKNKEMPSFEIQVEPLEYSWKINIVNQKFSGDIASGKVKYKMKTEEYWNTSDDYSFEVQKPGIYEVKVTDVAGNESEIINQYIYLKENLKVYLDTISYENNIWKDLSGNENTFNATDVSINEDKSISANSSSSKIENKDIEFPTSYTMEVVYKFNDYSKISCLWENLGNNYFSLRNGSNSGNSINLSYKNLDGNYNTIEDIINVDNSKHTIVVKFNSKSRICKIYSDGIYIVSEAIGLFENVSGLVLLNSNSESIPLTNGSIYAVRLYDKELTDQEIETNYNIDKEKFKF